MGRVRGCLDVIHGNAYLEPDLSIRELSGRVW